MEFSAPAEARRFEDADLVEPIAADMDVDFVGDDMGDRLLGDGGSRRGTLEPLRRPLGPWRISD